jgi:hypothetical protein
MNAVIGDMNERQENDFSKIQARFANRMPLNSADVAEVIQKRLLKKTEQGVESLADLYRREANNFGRCSILLMARVRSRILRIVITSFTATLSFPISMSCSRWPFRVVAA